MNRTALMIAYFFPPLGMGGVQRMSKLAKYLPQSGYDVKVLTVKPVRHPAYDETLLEELPPEVKIYRSGSIDPARLMRFLPVPLRLQRNLKTSAKNKAGLWPDSKIGWRKPAIKLGQRIIEKERVDIIISSSPPVSGHLIAMDLAAKYDLLWVADFRDIWESRPPEEVYKDISLIERSRKLLNEIGQRSDAITAINETIARQLSFTGQVIKGGFDPDDYKILSTVKNKQKFTLCYLGTIGSLHPIEPFFEAARGGSKLDSDFADNIHFRIIGANDKKSVLGKARQFGLEKRVELIAYLPHRRSLELAAESDATLLCVPSGYPDIMTGKIFDLMGLEIPILASVPIPGEACELINEYQGGICVAPDNPDRLVEKMLLLFSNWKNNVKWQKRDLQILTQMETAKQFAATFDKLINERT